MSEDSKKLIHKAHIYMDEAKFNLERAKIIFTDAGDNRSVEQVKKIVNDVQTTIDTTKKALNNKQG